MERALVFSLIAVLIIATLQTTSSHQAPQNFLLNPSFEEDNLQNAWIGKDFQMLRYSRDRKHGSYSLLCTRRTKHQAGPEQRISGLKAGGRYAFRGYVRLLKDKPRKLWQTFKALLTFYFGDPGRRENRYILAWRALANVQQGWLTLAGDLDAPMRNITGARLSIQGPEAGLDFLVDDLILYEVPEHPDWATQAFVNIDRHRKTNVQFQVKLPHCVDPAGVEIQLVHKKHLFAFGSKVDDDLIRENKTQSKRFQDIFYYLFNWATVQSYKWKYDKGGARAPDFSYALKATDILLNHGLKVRGHSILWGVKNSVPTWVQRLEGTRLRDAVFLHAAYMTNLTRGKLAHWDVQNEFLQGQYYEEKLQDPNITMEVFKLVRRLDPVPKLYLNDFQAVTIGGKTEAYHDLARDFKAAGTGIQGLGIQGHTKDFIKPDPTMMWRRLDRLAETGLELFMTEFDLGWPDEVVRADWLEDAVRAFFAHPGLSGLIFWDIWDRRQKFPHKGLISGPELKILEPYERLACLVKKEWSTHVTWRLSAASQTLRVRAFQGDYDVVVRKSGVAVQRLQMTLGKEDMVYPISVTASNVPIDIPAELDLVPQCVSHRGQRSMGVATSTVNIESPVCVQRTSRAGWTGRQTTEVSVTCDDGYLMTDCSSYVTQYQELGSQTRLSDKLEMNNGTATCVVHLYGVLRQPAELVAMAQCCRLPGLKCDYRVAGPSSVFDGARAEVACPRGYFPFGCSSNSRWSYQAGVVSTNTSCIAQNGPPSSTNHAQQSGVSVTAACCSGRVRCQILQSDSGKGKRAMVTCPPKHVMTGCSSLASDGQYRGVQTDSEASLCTAVSGTGTGVTVYAICCTAWR